MLIPLGAVVWHSQDQGLGGFWHAVTTPDAIVDAEADHRRLG